MPQCRPNQKPSEFISKLMDMMEKFPYHIGWTAKGDQLVFSGLRELEDGVLPGYFRHRKLSSFIRQLNMYGFCKKEQTQNFLKFRHKIFKRGNNAQFGQIKRKPTARIPKTPTGSSQQNGQQRAYTFLQNSSLTQKQLSVVQDQIKRKQNCQKVLLSLKQSLEGLLLQILQQPHFQPEDQEGECQSFQVDVKVKVEVQETQKQIRNQYQKILAKIQVGDQLDLALAQLNMEEEAKGEGKGQDQLHGECSFDHNLDIQLGLTNQDLSDGNMYIESRPRIHEDELSEFF